MDLLPAEIELVSDISRIVQVNIPRNDGILCHFKLHLCSSAQLCIMHKDLGRFRVRIGIQLSAENRHERLIRLCLIKSTLYSFALDGSQLYNFQTLPLFRFQQASIFGSLSAIWLYRFRILFIDTMAFVKARRLLLKSSLRYSVKMRRTNHMAKISASSEQR